MSLKFNKVKAQITIQDSGRWHYQSIGVPVSGAMDRDSLFQANALVGNDRSDAVLEIGIGDVEVKVSAGTLFAISGDSHRLLIDGIGVPSNRAILAAEEAVLKLKSKSEGMWSYVAVGGGVDVPKVLGSKSTYLQAGFGGLNGRALAVGDIIPSGKKSKLTESIIGSLPNASIAKWWIVPNAAAEQSIVRIAPGPEWNWLAEEQQNLLLGQTFSVSKDCSRMGYRLSGSPILKFVTDEMISSGVTKGTIQLTNDGSLIVLMADGQTVGGYPRIAQVAEIDISRVAQKRPGEAIRFRLIAQDEAGQLFLNREQERQQIAHSIRLKFA